MEKKSYRVGILCTNCKKINDIIVPLGEVLELGYSSYSSNYRLKCKNCGAFTMVNNYSKIESSGTNMVGELIDKEKLPASEICPIFGHEFEETGKYFDGKFFSLFSDLIIKQKCKYCGIEEEYVYRGLLD